MLRMLGGSSSRSPDGFGDRLRGRCGSLYPVCLCRLHKAEWTPDGSQEPLPENHAGFAFFEVSDRPNVDSRAQSIC